MIRLSLLSHAPTQSQHDGRFPDDEPVREPKPRPLPAAASLLSAPERRARQTAEWAGGAPRIASELRDIDYGDWAGRRLDDIARDDPQTLAAWTADPQAAPPGGESFAALAGRVGRWLDSHRQDAHVLAVTHPAVIRAAVLHVLDAPLAAFSRIDIAPLTLTDLRYNGRWALRALGVRLP